NYDSLYEYVEIYNNSGELLNISSLQLVDGGGNTVMISDQQLAAGATFLIARPGLLSRGIVPNITHDGGLSLNNRGESVRLVYNGQTIDEITYHSGWPYSAGHALTLDPSKYDTELNDEPSNWCASPTVYSVGSDATEKFSKVVD
ncbi:hypothetical protein COU76_01995, partial [Candidatus Peregrinibacteria bacterium CG10_big_fil_rev_8_21_14_0_10_49_10]